MARIPINDENLDESTNEPAGATESPEAEPPGRGGSGDDDVQKLRSERDSLYERLARATADFKNTQKRIQSESDQRVHYANQSLIKSLLPVIDNFERALAVDPGKSDVNSLLKGMQIVHDQWLKVLKDQKVEEIAPAPGEPFDPTQHEALMEKDAVYPVPTVVQLLQKGYGLHGRTLRPAQVAVSRSQ